MKSCKEVTGLISESLDRPLNWYEKLAVRTHILYCKSCLRFRRQMAFMRKAAERYRLKNHRH